MTYILVNTTTDKVLCGFMADGMYYTMTEGDIPVNSIILNDKYYEEMLTYEDEVYDIDNNELIDIKKLTKVNIKRA